MDTGRDQCRAMLSLACREQIQSMESQLSFRCTPDNILRTQTAVSRFKIITDFHILWMIAMDLYVEAPVHTPSSVSGLYQWREAAGRRSISRNYISLFSSNASAINPLVSIDFTGTPMWRNGHRHALGEAIAVWPQFLRLALLSCCSMPVYRYTVYFNILYIFDMSVWLQYV